MQTERQIQIVKSSIELIASKGIQGFTIKNLAKVIGISEPAIYRHFENKIEILITILNNFKEMSEMMSEMVVNSNDTANEKIEFMFHKIINYLAAELRGIKTTSAVVSVIFHIHQAYPVTGHRPV